MKSPELWQQILAAPGDADLRAQYVAALAEEGDPRAEVFRLVSQLVKNPVQYIQPVSSWPEKLYQQYENSLTQWRAELDAHAQTWRAGIIFVGGWPVEITINARDFIAHAAEIVTTLPLLHLNLKAVREAVEVFDVPQLDQVVTISGSNQRWTSKAINALATSAHLGALGWLSLSSAQLTKADIEILAAAPNLRGVGYIGLRNNRCPDPTDLANCGVDYDGSIVYVSLPHFGHELEDRHGRIGWLHPVDTYQVPYAPNPYWF